MESAINQTSQSKLASGAAAAGVVWRWSRDLDIEHASNFHAQALTHLRSGQSGRLILDLSQATRMDAAGLQILVAVAVQALNQGRFFEIAQAPYRIRRYLQLAGVGYLLGEE